MTHDLRVMLLRQTSIGDINHLYQSYILAILRSYIYQLSMGFCCLSIPQLIVWYLVYFAILCNSDCLCVTLPLHFFPCEM